MDEDYTDNDFEDAASPGGPSSGAPAEAGNAQEPGAAAAKGQSAQSGQQGRKEASAHKLPADFVPAETLAGGPAVATASGGLSAREAVPRSRSRLKLTSKGPTPSDGTVPLSARRNLSLPAISGGASTSAVGLLSTSVAEEELIASEQLSVAVSAEMQAQEHLRKVRARVQRELRRASSVAAMQKAKEDKLKTSREMRADMDKKVGRDLIRQIAAADIPPATDEEVKDMSVLLNKMLEMYHPDARNFFVLFKHIDIDGSRRISFSELERLIREELHIKKSELPISRLHALWRVLDDNGSGFVDPGELGRFMKIGRPEGGLGNRAKMMLEKQRLAKQAVLEMNKKS